MNKLFSWMDLIGIIILGNSYTLKAQDSTNATQKDEKQQKIQFVDEDGDGYNDNAPDHDGDGIPNGIDPDYQKMKAEQEKAKKKKYIDLDGDGINDYLLEENGNGNAELPHMNQQQNQGTTSGSMDQSGNQGTKGSGNKEKGKKAGGKH
jgi:hypothetical protein